jgi:ABC-2 type transport system permease protein
MKQFTSFIRKEFAHIFRDRRTMMILLVMPVVQIILFGFAITTEVKNTAIAVFDPSKDVSTQQIIERLQASGYFTLVEELHNPDEIRRVFQENKVRMAVVFSENFHENMLHTGENSIQLIADATDPNQALIFTGYASNIINQWTMDNNQLTVNNNGNNNSQTAFGGSRLPTVNCQVKMLYNPQMKGAYNFVPGVMGLILMLICAMMTSISIVREKERGTMEILLASPMKPVYIIVAKMTPYFVLSIVNLTTVLLLSVFVLDVPIAGNLLTLVSISLLFILTALSLGLLISNIASTQVAAMLISGMGLMMPTMLLSGMMFPIESMPRILQWFSSVFPVRWYIEAVRKLMIQGVDIVFVAREFAILAGMTLLILIISMKKFRIRLK